VRLQTYRRSNFVELDVDGNTILKKIFKNNVWGYNLDTSGCGAYCITGLAAVYFKFNRTWTTRLANKMSNIFLVLQ
jgi:hypothetical protein